MMFIRIFTLLILVALVGCKENRIPDSENQTLKEIYRKLEQQNTEAVMKVERIVLEEGSRPGDVKIKDSIVALLQRRKGLSFDSFPNKNTLETYHHFLVDRYRKTDEYDSLKVKTVERFYNEFENHKDSTIYRYLLINQRLIEGLIIDFYAARISQSCRWFYTYANVIKDQDTIQLGKCYSFSVVPEYYNYRLMNIELDSSFSVKMNNEKVSVPLEIVRMGGVTIIKLKPKKKGMYEVRGVIQLKSKISDFSLPTYFIDQFYVEEPGTEELTEITVYATGQTEPHIESQTCIFLVQDGKVSVGRFIREKDETGNYFIEHPKNETELNKVVFALIKQRRPELLQVKDAVVLTCTEEIERRMVW